jgi:hypothetical protein
MSDKSLALRVAGSLRRRVYPEVDRLRAKVRRLSRAVEKAEAEAAALAAKLQAIDDAKKEAPLDEDQQTREIVALTSEYTMTSPVKRVALIAAVRHIARTGLSGDIVECGVWRGGSIQVIARTFLAEGVDDRDIHLFDTFEGMTAPSAEDVQVKDGRSAEEILEDSRKTQWIWAIASIEDVQEGLRMLDYPYERFHFVRGPVEQTIPDRAPEQIALLRLDTDWYESTKHELEHLYDRLVPGGVLIIDDYGSWAGSRKATDEFLATLDNPPLMLRAGTGRIGVKP